MYIIWPNKSIFLQDDVKRFAKFLISFNKMDKKYVYLNNR